MVGTWVTLEVEGATLGTSEWNVVGWCVALMTVGAWLGTSDCKDVGECVPLTVAVGATLGIAELT
jgi:hypothetical protein